jgi:hypothetical protein
MEMFSYNFINSVREQIKAETLLNPKFSVMYKLALKIFSGLKNMNACQTLFCVLRLSIFFFLFVFFVLFVKIEKKNAEFSDTGIT